MITATKKMTIAEFAALPDTPRYELIRGELREVAAAKLKHGYVGGRFATFLGYYSLTTLPGDVIVTDVGFIIEEDPDGIVIAPDVAFYREGRTPTGDSMEDFVRVPPDVVVEVRSPSNSRREMREKTSWYVHMGVRLVWWAEPEELLITAHTGDGDQRTFGIDDVLDGGDVLPGFSVPVRAIFEKSIN